MSVKDQGFISSYQGCVSGLVKGVPMIFLKPNILFLLFFGLSLGCGKAITEITNTDEPVITIIGSQFVPDAVVVEPGDTIFFYNQDAVSHRILSQSQINTYDDSGLFDSYIITDETTGFITIPADSATGDVIYFYDDVLKDAMLTPNGTIEIQ